MRTEKVNYALGLSLSLLVIAGCGEDKKQSTSFPAPQSQGLSEATKTQSFIVRTNNQGKAEYATADFNNSTNKNELRQKATQVQNWKPFDSKHVISEKEGYPRSPQDSFYFIRETNSFDANPNIVGSILGSNANSSYRFPGTTPYGYYRYPNYGGWGSSVWYHNYPATSAWYGSYSYYAYQPVYYSGYNYSWYYWNACYYTQWGGYSYSYYSHW